MTTVDRGESKDRTHLHMSGNRGHRMNWKAMPLRGGLGRRILRWFLALSLIPLVLTNSVGYVISRGIIQDQTSRYLNALTAGEARHVAAEIARHHEALVAFVSGNPSLRAQVERLAGETSTARRAETAAGLVRFLTHEQAELLPLSDLVVIDTRGMVIAATEPDLVGREWVVPPSLRPHGEGQLFVDRFHDGEAEPHEAWFGLAAPIRSEDGTPLGMLVGRAGFDRLQEFLRIPPHLAGVVHTYLLDDAGRPLVVSHRHGHVDYDRVLPAAARTASDGAASRYPNYEGNEVIGTAMQVPGTDWRYVSEVSVASAFGQLRRLGLVAITFEAVFVFLLLAVVWLVAGSIIAPLHRLVAAAEHIRGGDLGVEVDVDSADEIGDLGRTFNQMSQELRRSSEQITELHDQELRRAAQLASVGELASGIAHEIKNPLVGLVSGVDLLEQEIVGGGHARAEGVLHELRVQLRRMEGAIRDLLRYARPKPPRLARAKPAMLVDRTIPLVKSQADAAGVSITTTHGDQEALISVDPELMTQALVNLALNGVQAMTAGGTLEIATDRVGPEVHITVADSGCGIPEERLGEIFRPFFTSKHRGTGLGLAISRGIVERHDGRLEVESVPGVGSTFRIVLPVAAGREEP
jgi:signal transduction histidine kinase